jgi:hypothetical protein
VLEAEMTEALGAEKGERASGRQGYRSGYYDRTLITRVGSLIRAQRVFFLLYQREGAIGRARTRREPVVTAAAPGCGR